MPSLSTVLASRAAAGADFAAKADALVTAYVELQALDQSAENSAVGGPRQRSFSGEGLHIPTHGQYYPTPPAGGDAFGDRVRTRLLAILAS